MRHRRREAVAELTQRWRTIFEWLSGCREGGGGNVCLTRRCCLAIDAGRVSMWGAASSVLRRSDIHATPCSDWHFHKDLHSCKSARSTQLTKHSLVLHALDCNASGIDHAEARHAHRVLRKGRPRNSHLFYPCSRSYGSSAAHAACECQKCPRLRTVMHNMRLPAFTIVGRHVGVH